MNTIRVIETEYIRGSRTIETVLVSNDNSDKTFFVYNYEGVSLRVFEYLIDLMAFFQGKRESDYHFNSDNKLDEFLSEVKIS